MNLKKEEINLLDGVNTEEFGYVRFFTVQDLLNIGEESYNKIMSLYAQNIELYEGFKDKFKMFDLLILRFQDGSRLSLTEKETLLDIFIFSLTIIYDIDIKDIDKHIVVNEKVHSIFIAKGEKLIKINRDNYDSFCDIVLKSNMIKRMEKEEELKFKNKEIEDAYRKRVEEFLAYAKKDAERNRNSILTIANLVMAKLKLYDDKKSLLSMTIHNLLFAFSAENEEDIYDKKYKQYLAGADIKKLDMVHWQEKIKEMIKKEE